MTSAPAVPTEQLAGWRLVDERVDTPFDIKLITVTAHTNVYEDAELSAAIQDSTGIEGPGRFFLTSHVVLKPQPPTSEALRRLVTDRVARDFAHQLRDRGFTRVEETGRRAFSVSGADARLVSYESTYAFGTITLDVQGWLAVWQVGGDFLLAGGAYPTSVRNAASEETAEAVQALLHPSEFRDELFSLVRAVEPP
ncbi:DUF6517 family protein [Halogranum rubrum]|uniref:Uncharacterized protein n=1 Tax=Halogranum salarium B-1 TaxID=1210908 RepID=J3F0A1_9EURY|nr:DUF6517 family protein [Halogranum salarium]EJN61472.1 hypothetical protein HSB1_05130 [Halogranum salarium B-1]